MKITSTSKLFAISLGFIAISAVSPTAFASSLTTSATGGQQVENNTTYAASGYTEDYDDDYVGAKHPTYASYSVFDFTPSSAVAGTASNVTVDLYDEAYSTEYSGDLSFYITSDVSGAENYGLRALASATDPDGGLSIQSSDYSNLNLQYLGTGTWTPTGTANALETTPGTSTSPFSFSAAGLSTAAITDLTDGDAYSIIIAPGDTYVSAQIDGYTSGFTPTVTVNAAPAPEAATVISFGVALLGLGGLLMFKRKPAA